MELWWAMLFIGSAIALCRLLLMLIPPVVPAMDVDASDVLDDGSQTTGEGYIYIPRKGKGAQAERVQCYEPATMKYLGFFPSLDTR